MAPMWLTVLAIVSLALAFICAGIILVDELTGDHPLMPVMMWVWPVTALYMGPVAVWAYWTMDRSVPMQHSGSSGGSQGTQQGQERPLRQEEQQHQLADAQRTDGRSQSSEVRRRGEAQQAQAGRDRQEHQGGQDRQQQPFWQIVFKGVTHCGTGCTLGDIIGEWGIFISAATLAGIELWPDYIADYILAYAMGIVFQYLAIAPMRSLGLREGIVAAIKADTLSLTAFEVGLFAWMAITQFMLFDHKLHPDDPVYWFMMQIGMVVGFATSYPMNWWLIKKGIKEKM